MTVNAGTDSITLNWDQPDTTNTIPVTGSEGYCQEMSGARPITTATGTSTGLTVTGLEPGTDYVCSATLKGNRNRNSHSEPATVVTRTAAE